MTPGQEVVLDDALRQLRLPAMVREWREYARQAKEAGEGYPGFLLALASRELEQRQANQIQRRLRTARFPRLKTLETMHALRRLGLKDTAMAHAQCGTIRLKLLKIGARIRLTVRNVWISMSEAYPYPETFALIMRNLQSIPLRC